MKNFDKNDQRWRSLGSSQDKKKKRMARMHFTKKSDKNIV